MTRVPEFDFYAAMVNTDLTEGRGYNYPYVCSGLEETALRLGKGKNVQGSNAYIEKVEAIRVNGTVYIPHRYIYLTSPSKDDIKNSMIRIKTQQAEERLKALGASQEDINLIKQM